MLLFKSLFGWAVTLYKALEVFGSRLSGHELKIPGSKLYFKT